MSIHFSSVTNEWHTPQDLFDSLNKQFCFTLDPCSNDENAKCEKHYTQADDGLSKSWAGETVFMNPPYGREIGKWVEKAYRESLQSGTVVVCLIPARTDTKYWHDYVMKAHYVHLVKGRVKFGGGLKTNAHTPGAPFPSAVVVFGKSVPNIACTGQGFRPDCQLVLPADVRESGGVLLAPPCQ